MASSSSGSTIDPTSPLYLHPSDGTNSINVEKLTGASNYRAWRRSFEIALASKRKLGFVTGGVKRDRNDKVKQECWDTCNSMVISWILSSVSDPIKKSIMFMNEAAEIWKHLEKRYSITNGAKKYSLNKQLYETKQQGKPISEYYTNEKEELEGMAMYTKRGEVTCKNCGKTGHPTDKCWACKACGKPGHTYERCWTVIGFPPKGQKNVTGKGGKEAVIRGQQYKGGTKGNKGKQYPKQRLEANACSKGEGSSSVGITAEQLEQLGEVELRNGIKLMKTMYTPAFKHNLLSVQKLTEQEECKVIFFPNYCIIEDTKTSRVRGVGRAHKGVYHLINEPVCDTLNELSSWMREGRRMKEGKLAAHTQLAVPTTVKRERKNFTT
ncbi:Gag-Pol polyprotein, partial [Bienertia sinuspersici]